MLESRDTEIISEMRKIEGIYDYWEIQKQIGYQFYGKTNDRKYLGWVVLAEHILKNLDNSKLDNLKKADIKEESSNAGGYDSTVEK
ncbi:MAG: hypothetical protein Q8L27_04225 [archaeon]|nr:hypothetical protein [archaeon]